MCCEKITLPGELVPKRFLQQAENALLGHIVKNSPLNIEQPIVFPQVIGTVENQCQHGFEAEYRIHDELKKSNLQIYVFYSPKIERNEEVGDFLLISKNALTVIEVKASKLGKHLGKSELDLEKFQKKLLSKQFEKQQERVISLLGSLLKNHHCKPDSVKINYYYLFPNIKHPNLTEKQMNMNLNNVFFQDDYIRKLYDLTTNQKEVITADCEYSLRTLVAW